MVVELKKLSNDEKIKQQMEARADYESRIATARGAGKKEGIKEGIQSTILNMLEDDVPDDKIILYTGCDIKMIEELRNSVQ